MAVEVTPARLGKTVVIRGEVKGSEDLVIDGHVEGAISLAENRLTIGPNADVLADLSARDVLIQGKLKGNIVATGRVELRAGSAVEGDVRALRLAIEDNAVFRGKVDLTQGRKEQAGRRQSVDQRRCVLSDAGEAHEDRPRLKEIGIVQVLVREEAGKRRIRRPGA